MMNKKDRAEGIEGLFYVYIYWLREGSFFDEERRLRHGYPFVYEIIKSNKRTISKKLSLGLDCRSEGTWQ
jgi:hypothetical protein